MTGSSSSDILYGYAGNDSLIGGTGNDYYVFNTGDMLDTINDTAGSDIISLDITVNKNNVAFYSDSTNLYIDYGSTAGNDKVTVNNWNDTNYQLETVELYDGEYITNIQINQVIQDMTAYAAANSITLASVDDVKNNADLMNIVNVAWHN